MNIWSGKPHTGIHVHALTYVLTHSLCLERTQTLLSEGLGKSHPAVLSSLPPAPLGTGNMDPWNGLLFPSVNVFTSHIYISLCSCGSKLKELTWVWKIIKRGKWANEAEEEGIGLQMMREGEEIGTSVVVVGEGGGGRKKH